MLDRNRRIKPKPERFQECGEHFDLIITCEERVYDQVIEGIVVYFLYEEEECFFGENTCLHVDFCTVVEGKFSWLMS